MDSSQQVAELSDLISQLRAADTKLRVFGAASHRYRLGDALTESQLRAFEGEHQIELPGDYRGFLKEIGNGGVGPDYGLETLANAARYRDLRAPFPLLKNSTDYSPEELEAHGDRDDYAGVLEFCHQGCGIYFYLVVRGATYGTLWQGREDFYQTDLTFYRWYRNWADENLRQLRNEPLVDQIALGMTKAEVVELTRGNWQERTVGATARRRPVILLECADFWAQLRLDERGIVIQINRYRGLP